MLAYGLPETLESEIDDLEGLISDHEAGRVSAGELKARRVPFGVYEQRTDGAFMVRVRCAGGIIAPEQLRVVATLAAHHGSGRLHLTTRQEIQIHDLPMMAVVPVIRGLKRVGLSSRGGGGNTVRNIMASHDSGVAVGETFDVAPYAVALTTRLCAEPDSWTLPRKFKITFANGPADNANARFNDLGFVASVRGGEQGFEVYVAGGLGTKPEVAHLLHDFVSVSDVYAVARAVKEVFSRNGNRRNRHAARLRFLWRSLGRDGFVKLYEREREAIAASGAAPLGVAEPLVPGLREPPPQTGRNAPGFDRWRERYVSEQKQPGLFSVSLPVFLGMIDAERVIALCDFLGTIGEDVVRLTMRQNLHLRNIPEAWLPEAHVRSCAFSDLSAGPAIFGNMVACAGADTCRLGICQPRGLARAVRRELSGRGLDLDMMGSLQLNISGCPNSCGQHLCADLGFYGFAARTEAGLHPAYLIVGGCIRSGSGARMASRLGSLPARAVPEFVGRLARRWTEIGLSGGGVAGYLDARGDEEVTALCEAVAGSHDDPLTSVDWDSTSVFSLEGRGPGECSAGVFNLIDLDLATAREARASLAEGTSAGDAAAVRQKMVFAAARALLVTKGIDVRSGAEACRAFDTHFVTPGLVDRAFGVVLNAASSGDHRGLEALEAAACALVDAVDSLYASMDDSLLFSADRQAAVVVAPDAVEQSVRGSRLTRDFRGVPCPMNFVKTKVALSGMRAGQVLEILLDDGAPIENVPRSVAGEGHEVLEQVRTGAHWTVVIRKRG